MATVRDIITDAYRIGGIIGLSEEAPAEEADYGLIGLQSMLHSWINSGMFGTMTDVFKTDDYTASENERVTVDSAVVTIPYTFEDDCGETRAPLQLSAISVVTGTGTTSYIYDRRQWIAIEAMTLNDTCPLAEFGRRGLAACLALELAALPTFGGVPTPGVLQAARSFKQAVISTRYAAHNVSEPEYF